MKRTKKLLNKDFGEIKADLDGRIIGAYDCMARVLEEFDERIFQACKVGHTAVRDAQAKIKELLDYLSMPQNASMLERRDLDYFRTMYQSVLDRYHLDLDSEGVVRGARVGRFIKQPASSSYSREVVKDPFRNLRT